MANDKKFVVKKGLATPNVDFANGGGSISATFLTTSNTLSFSGNTGQLFSITDSMSGTIFSVNDISGIPSIEVIDTGSVKIAETFGTVAVGANTLTGYKFYVSGNTLLGNSVTLNSTLIANGSVGTSGFVLTSNGTGVYWAAANANITSVANAVFATTANNALRFNGKQESQLSVANAVFADTANNALRFNGKQESQLDVSTANNSTYLQGRIWETAGAIGATVANTGAFTTLTASANVGIGTTTPQYKLDVNRGSAGIQASFGSTFATGGISGIHFGYSESASANYRKSAIVFERDDASFGDARGKVHILNAQSGSGSATIADTKLTIDSSGNIGFGNTTPGQKLQVAGSVGITSGLVANGSFGTNGHVLTSNGTAIYWAAANSSISSIANATFATTANNALFANSASFVYGKQESQLSVAAANTALYLQNRTWETAGAIGSTVANTGAFTSLTASANVNLDSGTFFVDGTTNRVGISNTNPTTSLHVQGGTLIGGDGSTTYDFKLQRLNSGIRAVQHDFAAAANSPWILHGESLSWTGERAGTVEPTQAYRPYYEAFAPVVGYREFGFVNVTSGSFTGTNLIPNLVLTNTGRVGIGTTNPSANLDVVGTAGGSSWFVVRDSSSNVLLEVDNFGKLSSGRQFTITPNAAYSNIADVRMTINGASGQTGNMLNITGFGASAGNLLNVTASGLVGIGTTTPSTPLSFGKAVYGNTDSENFFRIKFEDVGGTQNDIGIGQPVSGSLGFNVNPDGYIAWYGGTNGERMRLNGNTGNVGIGNTAPGQKLQVAGSVGITGGIVANGTFGADGTVLTSNGTSVYWGSVSASSGGFTGNTVSANATIVKSQSYYVNAAAGWVNMTMPSSIATGDIFIVHSQTGNTRILNNTINIMDVGAGNDLVLESGQTVWVQAVNTSAVGVMFTYPAGGVAAVVANSTFATTANNSLYAFGKQESQLSVAASANAVFATTANNSLFSNSASFVYGKQESQLSVATSANSVFATTANNSLRFNGKQESQLDVSTANNATTFLSGRRWETAGAIGATVANTGVFTLLTTSANTTFTGNTFFRGGVVANGSLGANGLVLTSNGTSVFWGSITTGTVANATFATTANNSLFANSASFVYGKQESQLSVSTANNSTYLQGRIWETAGAIGSTVANTGAFTSLTASANVNFDSGTLFVDGTTNRVGIGNTTPITTLDVRGNIAIGGVDAGPNFITFRGTTGDEPGNYNHTYIGERIYSGTEASELFIFKGNDPETTSGPDRVRIGAAEFRVDTYSTALSGAFDTVASSASLTNKFIITNSGNVAIGSTTAPTKLYVNGHMSVANGFGIYANGVLGANGLVLTSNGTSLFWGSITASAAANATFATTANNALFANSASFVYGKQESQLSVATSANAVFATTANNALRFNGKQESQLSVANTANSAALQGATWQAPLGIGAVTANTGVFTLLTTSANTIFTGNTFFRGGIVANSSLGANGLILTSNGTSVFWGSITTGTVANATFATTANNALFANSASFVYGKQESQLSVSTANNSSFLAGRRWETAGAIGSTTANTGAFTTLTASANVNFDGGTLFVDGTNNRVGVGTTNPVLPFVVSAGGVGGVEIDTTGLIQSFNRNTQAYQNMTFDAAEIVFRPAGTERMRFTGSGNVAIGSTTAPTRLYVNGHMSVANGFGIYANGVLGSNGTVLTSNGTSLFWGSVSTSGPVANATFATTANNALFANSASFVYGKQESQLSVATSANAVFATTANNALRFNGKQESQLDVSTANNATTFLSGRRWETAGAIGSTTANTGAFTTVSTTGTTTMSGGANSIVLSNATSNRIMWGAGGVAAPTFTSYSAGAKLVLSDSIAAASAGHAIGVETSTMWFGTSTNTEQFKWYGGTTNYMSSNTTGLTHTGNITAYSSDKRLKKNITLIENAIDKVQQIGGYTFDWDKELCDKYEFIPGNIHEHGVIAQEIEKIIPDAVTRAPFDIGVDGGSRTGENYLTVRYDRIVPLLIEAIKDQQTQIDELKELVKTLINREQDDG